MNTSNKWHYVAQIFFMWFFPPSLLVSCCARQWTVWRREWELSPWSRHSHTGLSATKSQHNDSSISSPWHCDSPNPVFSCRHSPAGFAYVVRESFCVAGRTWRRCHSSVLAAKKDTSSIWSPFEYNKWAICFSGRLRHALDKITYNNIDLNGPHLHLGQRQQHNAIIIKKIKPLLKLRLKDSSCLSMFVSLVRKSNTNFVCFEAIGWCFSCMRINSL